MSVFNITAPDGTKYKVQAPEDATDEEALLRVQKEHAATVAPAIPGTGMKGMGSPPGFPEPPTPAELDALKAAGKPWPKPFPDETSAEPGLLSRLRTNYDTRMGQMEKIAQGVAEGKIGRIEGLGEMGLKFAQQLPDAGYSAIAYASPQVINDLVEKAVSGGIGAIADTAAGRMVAGAVNDFTQNHPDATRRISAAGDVFSLAAPLLPIGKGGSFANRVADTAGDVAAAGGKVAAGAAKAVGSAALPNIPEGLAETALLARKYNIPLSLDQVSGSRAIKTLQKLGQDLPFSGQAAFREKQLLSLQKELFKTVGVDADMFTPKTMERAFKKVGGEFDSLTKGRKFSIGQDFVGDLAATADEVASTYGNDAAQIFQREASKVINDFSGDVISGELIAKQRARINGLARKATDPNIKGALLDLETNIVDGITSKDKLLAKALTKAKERYKNLIVLEPVANKAKGGMINPTLLNNRVSQVYKRAHTVGNSGAIGDLARVGNELLGELGGSDTAQKMFMMGAAIPTAGFAPVTTATTLGANRAFQSGINRNQSLIDAALKKANVGSFAKITEMKPNQARKVLESMKANQVAP